MELICKYCGVKFQSNRRKMYCSVSCSKKASNVRCGVTKKQHTKVCPVCNEEFSTVYTRKIYCSDRCLSKASERRRHTSWEEYTNELVAEKKARQQIKSEQRKQHEEERECVICGKTFTCLKTDQRKTCSSECSARYNKVRNRSRNDKRIPQEQIIDKDINLDRLILRDNNKCYICGCECNKNDIRLSKKNNPYPGKTYPTIEHVIPICRGGLHSWLNVRLACWECNNKKGTDIEDVDGLDYEFAYQYKSKKKAKNVAQMSLDGKIIKIWSSVKQVATETGWKEKQIRRACTGKAKTAYRYTWRYTELTGENPR